MNTYSFFIYIAPVLIILQAVSTVVGTVYPWTQWCKVHKWLFIVTLVVITLIPFFEGLSVADLLLSLNPNYSIGIAILLAVSLVQRFGGISLFSSRNIYHFSLWNTGLGLILYAGSLGFLPYDIYPMGYDFSLLFWIICALTIILVLVESRLKWAFVSYIIAWNLNLLPSPNFFDYMMDLFLFLTSISIVVTHIFRSNYSMRFGY